MTPPISKASPRHFDAAWAGHPSRAPWRGIFDRHSSGDRLRPRPGELKPECDPDTTTLTGRCQVKVAELQAKLLRPDAAGCRTLIRWENDRRRFGLTFGELATASAYEPLARVQLLP